MHLAATAAEDELRTRFRDYLAELLTPQVRAELALTGKTVAKEGFGDVFGAWPKQYGWWLERREPGLRKLGGPALPFRRA